MAADATTRPRAGLGYWFLTLVLLPAAGALIMVSTFWLFALADTMTLGITLAAPAGVVVVGVGVAGVSSLRRLEGMPGLWRAGYCALSAVLQGSIAVVTSVAIIAPRLPH